MNHPYLHSVSHPKVHHWHLFIYPFTPHPSVVSVAPDESVLQEEREKVRQEYEAKMEQMKKDMMAEQENNALLQANMENLRKQYEDQINDIKVKEVQVSVYRYKL